MTELPAIHELPSDYDEIFHRILDIIRDEIYLPLVVIVDQPERKVLNAREDLLRALIRGQIVFSRGAFSGKFNSQISKELKDLGARWQKGEFRIPMAKLPKTVKEAISASEFKFQKMSEKVDKKLSQILPDELVGKVHVKDLIDSKLWQVSSKIEKHISVPVKFTKEESAKIADEYTNDLRRYIKDWTEEEIRKLRNEVQVNALKGNRYEDLIEMIRKSYGVGVNKARFLARQETSLFMSKFKETRYSEAGVKEYKWGCVVGSANHPVRKMHKALEGKIFRWDDPPVTSPDGKRNNPGQDYNCRCFARPIIR